MRIRNIVISKILLTSVWVRYGWKYNAPVRPDTVMELRPSDIQYKTIKKPPTGRIPPMIIAGGDWDRQLEPVTDDIVYKAFRKRFVEGKPWDETEYVEFLSKGVSEHGNRSTDEAKERCGKIDKLYAYIKTHGYKSQKQLESEGALIQGLSKSIRPPAYREIAVNVTRDGEFVWHAGMHRLVISKLLGIDKIPVRINVRHSKWQEIREEMYSGQDTERFEDHPDINWLK